MILASLERTCIACPSQWEGTTPTGQHFYARYRWGCLTWGFGDTPDAAIDASIFGPDSLQCGDHYDGDMTTERMLGLTNLGGAAMTATWITLLVVGLWFFTALVKRYRRRSWWAFLLMVIVLVLQGTAMNNSYRAMYPHYTRQDWSQRSVTHRGRGSWYNGCGAAGNGGPTSGGC